MKLVGRRVPKFAYPLLIRFPRDFLSPFATLYVTNGFLGAIHMKHLTNSRKMMAVLGAGLLVTAASSTAFAMQTREKNDHGGNHNGNGNHGSGNHG